MVFKNLLATEDSCKILTMMLNNLQKIAILLMIALEISVYILVLLNELQKLLSNEDRPSKY